MKIQSNNQRGFTVIEMLVVVAIIAFLACFLIPSLARAKARANRIRCTSHLKQVGMGFRLWANDHEEQYPFTSTNAAGSFRWVNSPEVFRHYQVMSNELVTPRILVCPRDSQRKPTENFSSFSNDNLSYFVGFDAREDAPQTILSGDWNLTGGTLSNGFLRVITPNTAVEWTKEIHQSAGNIGLGDGSVQQVTTAQLRQQLALQTNAFIRLAVP
jgi:prepilin-type N-terminal cleavage/methylation domain-containing protein